MLAAEEEGESMAAAAAAAAAAAEEEVEWRRCRFRYCVCCWDDFPSGRVAPGIDYVCTPDPDAAADDDHLPAWSLLVGVADGASSLRLSRLRVARSGRILGRSDDALEVFHDIVLAKPPRYTFQARVAPLASDGRSLCVLHQDYHEQPQALQLTLHPQQPKPQAMPLPEIEGTTSYCIPFSADGQTWALSATRQADHINTSLTVVTRRLVPAPGGGRRWELVGGPFTTPIAHKISAPWMGDFLQGYAVIPDAKLVLVSFQQYGLFLTFAPGSGRWARVLAHTDKRRSERYLPIVGRGAYVEQHKAVYFLCDNIVYAYKLAYQKDGQLKLDLPIVIDYVCPFTPGQGYGILTRLAGLRMCSVWLSLAQHTPCPCENLHAIVTTFDLLDAQDPAEGGIKLLHSTYRRVDMVPNPPAEQQFCFLQEYEDQEGSPVLQQRGEEQDDLTTSQQVDETSKMLHCCRNMLEVCSLTFTCFNCGKDDGQCRCSFEMRTKHRRCPPAPIPPADEQQFCFLQEYEDQSSIVLQQRGEEEEGLTSSQHVDKPSKMLSCCRNMQDIRSITFRDFQCGMDGGHIAHMCSHGPAEEPSWTIPPLGLTRSLPVDPASRQHQVCSTSPLVHVKGATTPIKKDLIIICQGGSQVVIYQTGAMDDDVKPIELCCAAVGDRDWHFFKNGSKIQAVSSMKDGMFEFSMNKDRPTCKRPLPRPNAGPFVMVARVGQETVALTETLQIYHQTQFNYGPTTSWLLYKADESKVVFRRVDISGYVAMGDDSLIVCDAITCSCLHFDLGAKQWSVVMPLAAFKKYPPDPTEALLNGRCVFVDGFIYTCRKGGLAAYELLREDHSLYLSQPIFLPLSRVHCVGEGICLDYAGKDVDSGATLLYVVQDEYSPQKYGVRSTTFSITTVKVRTKRTASNKMKPVGIDHMDSVTRFIHEAMDVICCFAV